MKRLMFALCASMLFLSGCINGLDMKTVHNEPNFAGVVVEVFDNSILVSVNENDAPHIGGGLAFVSLDVYLRDSMTDFMSGDEVVVFFDGMILDSYPLQIVNVYAIILTSQSKRDVWHSTVKVEVSHTLDGHRTSWSFNEKNRIDELYNWFAGLNLSLVSTVAGDVLCVGDYTEVYEFTLTISNHFSWDEDNGFTVYDNNGDSFMFAYGKIGVTWYLLFGEYLYEVNNPSRIIFPVKDEAIIFDAIVTLEGLLIETIKIREGISGANE